MSETSKFCPKIKKFLSENVREHKKSQMSTHAKNRVVVCFHKKNKAFKSKDLHNYKIKSSNENLWKQTKSVHQPSQPLKMHKHTKNQTTKKSICPKTNSKYSFDTPKFLVRISQTFVRVLSEKSILGQNFGHFRTKCP